MEPFYNPAIDEQMDNAHIDQGDEAMADWRELKDIRDQVRERGLVHRSIAEMVQQSYGVEVSPYPGLNNYSEFPATAGLESFLTGVDNAVEERALSYLRGRISNYQSVVARVRASFTAIDPTRALRALKGIPALHQASVELKALMTSPPGRKSSDTLALKPLPPEVHKLQTQASQEMSKHMTELTRMVFVDNPELMRVVSEFETFLIVFLEDFHLRLEYIAKVLQRANSAPNDDIAAMQLTQSSRTVRLESLLEYALKQGGIFKHGEYAHQPGEIFLWTIADQIGTTTQPAKPPGSFLPADRIVDILATSSDHRVQFPSKRTLLLKELSEVDTAMGRLAKEVKLGSIRERADLLKPIIDGFWSDMKVIVALWKYLSHVVYARDSYLTVTAQYLLVSCRAEALQIQLNAPHNVDAANKIIQDVNRAMKA